MPAEWGGRQAQGLLTLLLSTRPLVCCHCRGRIDPALRGTTSRQRPSVEHIIPRSRGGTNDLGNLALAHLACNSSRGNRFLRRPAQADARFFSPGG